MILYLCIMVPLAIAAFVVGTKNDPGDEVELPDDKAKQLSEWQDKDILEE